MMSRTLGAPLGGTTRGGHQGVESLALSLITPPNFGGGGGSCLPSIVVVALGEPGVPVICWATAPSGRVVPRITPNDNTRAILSIPLPPIWQPSRLAAQPFITLIKTQKFKKRKRLPKPKTGK